LKIKSSSQKNKVKVDFIRGCVSINNYPARMYDVEYTMGEMNRYCWLSSDGILVKFNDRVLRQSEKEIRIWKSLDDEDVQYFPRVLDWEEGRNGWIAEKFEIIRHRKKLSLSNQRILFYIADKYKISDIYYGLKNNYGIREDGSLIIYDFGL